MTDVPEQQSSDILSVAYQASCLCGEVAFDIQSIVLPYVLCHCTSCKKATGAAYAANISVPLEDFKVTKGAKAIQIYESSPGKYRHFCSSCAAPLYTTVGVSPKFARVRLGSLDSDFSVPPAAHIFVQSKADWETITDDLPQYSSWPHPDEVQIPGSRQSELHNE